MDEIGWNKTFNTGHHAYFNSTGRAWEMNEFLVYLLFDWDISGSGCHSGRWVNVTEKWWQK